MAAKRQGGWGEMVWEFGINTCKPLYIRWVNNEVLLYSTGNYIQYPVINNNRKEHKKIVYMYNGITAAHLKLNSIVNQLYIKIEG